MQEVCEKERKMCAIQLYLIFVVIFFFFKKEKHRYKDPIFFSTVLHFGFCMLSVFFCSFGCCLLTSIHHSFIYTSYELRETRCFRLEFFFHEALACINALLRLFQHNKCISCLGCVCNAEKKTDVINTVLFENVYTYRSY